MTPPSPSPSASALEPSIRDLPDVAGVEPLPPGRARVQRVFVLFDVIVPVAAVVAAIVLLWGSAVSWTDLGIAAGYYVATVMGITIGFHRLFTHKGFDAPAPIRALFAVLGTMSLQGPIIQWCADHRRHHAYSDREGDPHSPHIRPTSDEPRTWRGFLWAHVGWMFAPVRSTPNKWVPDLLRDPVVVRVDRLYVPLALVSILSPGIFGFALTGTLAGTLTAILWGGLVRLFVALHMTWSINSVCHVFGNRPYFSRDESRNVWALSWLSMGESWHNNHHAFPSSARHGIDRWQPDPSAFVIERLERFGLVSNVSRVSDEQKSRRRLDTTIQEL